MIKGQTVVCPSAPDASETTAIPWWCIKGAPNGDRPKFTTTGASAEEAALVCQATRLASGCNDSQVAGEGPGDLFRMTRPLTSEAPGSSGKMLNEALRLVRIYHDKNQTEMAELLSVSKSYLSEIEAGTKSVTMNLLEKYSRALDVPMSSLLFFAEEIEGIEHPSRKRVAVANRVIGFLKLLAHDREIDEQEKRRKIRD